MGDYGRVAPVQSVKLKSKGSGTPKLSLGLQSHREAQVQRKASKLDSGKPSLYVSIQRRLERERLQRWRDLVDREQWYWKLKGRF